LQEGCTLNLDLSLAASLRFWSAPWFLFARNCSLWRALLPLPIMIYMSLLSCDNQQQSHMPAE